MTEIYPIDVAKESLFTLKEVAALFKVSEKTAQRMKKAGDFPDAIVINNKVLYPSGMVNRYLLKKNPHLIEQVASANQLNEQAMAAIQEGKANA